MPIPTRTEPVTTPAVSPTIDPGRRLNPDRLCPGQKDKVVKRTLR